MLSENYLVKKTTPLIYAEWLALGVNELKIVEVYLSRLNIQKGETTVRFTKKEFADLMGYADSRNLKTKVFDERLSKFLSQQIKMNLDDGNGYHRFTLFSDAKCYYDPETGMSMVEIDCNPKLAPVFLNLADGSNEGYKYISYRVERTRKMESAYSIRLYNLLLDHLWGNYKWVVDIEQLRTVLGATASSYESYKYFNATVLKKAQKEINKLTDISFEYERMTKGKKTTGIIFKISKKKEYIEKNTDTEIKEGIIDLSETDFREQIDIFELARSNNPKKREEYEVSVFKEKMKRINDKWKITKPKILEISCKIWQHIPQVTEGYEALPDTRKDIIWMNFMEDMLRKAAAEDAQKLYPFIMSQWDRYICEIRVRKDV